MYYYISIEVMDFDRSYNFYQSTLPIIYGEKVNFLLQENTDTENHQTNKQGVFWVDGVMCLIISHFSHKSKNESTISELKTSAKIHIAFGASSQNDISLWYETALKLGGQDNGQPQNNKGKSMLTPEYAAFIIDPDGYSLEAGTF